jgi:hypothetical protein
MYMRSFSGCATHGVLEIQILKIVMLADANYHLIARVHVDTAPKAMVQPAILDVILRNRNSRTVRSRSAGTQGGEDRGERRQGVARSGDAATHPFDAIVTIGAAFPFINTSRGPKRRRLDELRGGGVNKGVSGRAGHGTVCS